MFRNQAARVVKQVQQDLERFRFYRQLLSGPSDKELRFMHLYVREMEDSAEMLGRYLHESFTPLSGKDQPLFKTV